MTEREIFLAAMEKEGSAARATYLEEACGADALLRKRIDALFHCHDGASDFMKVPVVEQIADSGEGLEFLAPSSLPDSLGRLGHFEILEVVGRGGMGVVFRAFDTKLHRVVAIKALASQLATSHAARQRFVREARAAAAVSHEHVIAIHSVEDAGSVPYLVMQFIDGPTLQKKLDRTGQLPLKEILRIGLQIAEGLAAAHRQGLIHRDVKPANILLENGVERVKITDFGLARAGDDASLSQSGVVMGTPMYMSPEQAQGLPIDFRSDLFSLGSVMYTMCTGRPPFRAPSPMAVLKRVCEQTPRPIREINPEWPQWLEEFVTRLHAKVAADRFASAREVADLLALRLAELQQGGTPSTMMPEPVAKPRRSHGRWPIVVAVLAPLAGLGLCEMTGITNLRGKVTHLAPPEGSSTPTPLSGREQVEAVAAKLKDLNPGFDGKVTPTFNGEVVIGLRFSTDEITNIEPVRELTRLKVLDVSGTEGKLADLTPLAGLSLTSLSCSRTKVTSLSALQGMPLTRLEIASTEVSDLTPLAGMPLEKFYCGGCSRISDLTPLKKTRLTALDIGGSGVSDLTSLQGLPLKELNLFGATLVTDLAPLKGMPLENLNLGHLPVTDLSPLKDMTALHTLLINDTPVADISALKGLPLKRLSIRRTNVTDLSPLKAMSVSQLLLDYQPERDAEVLRSLKGLEQINDQPAAVFLNAKPK